MTKFLALVLLLSSPQGCIILPVIPHYDDSLDSRGWIPDSAQEFIKDGETPLSEILLRLGEPDWVAEDGRLIAYRWELVQYIVVGPLVGAGFGRGHFLVIGLNDEGICVKHRTVSTNAGLRETMRYEFGHQWKDE